MATNPAPIDLAPLLAIAVIGIGLAALPLAWWWRRRRTDRGPARLRSLAVLTLFLAADLVLLGAFTRLSDSGLGCPDWPGCYGHASPIGAAAQIASAEGALPGGPVTLAKAWIEMAHRYAAAAIGVLSIALALLAVRAARRREVAAAAPAWAIATALWVVVQGGFGALTVTMRLHPGIVTLHLLGGMALLGLLAAQVEALRDARPAQRLVAPPSLRVAVVVAAVLLAGQLALGGWVSSNYAVLACSDFPTCQGRWWPDADFGEGFHVLRSLGEARGGAMLPFQALTAIHLAHRIGALAAFAALLVLCALLWRRGAEGRRFAAALLGLCAWQAASGLGNVLLGWPLAAAVAHTAGGAGMVVVATTLSMRLRWGVDVGHRLRPRPATHEVAF